MDKKQILAIASQTNFLPQAVERDYYSTLILNNIQTLLSDQIAVHGSAAVHKIHYHHFRINEDLDFSFYKSETLMTRDARLKAVGQLQQGWSRFLKALHLRPGQPAWQERISSRVYGFYAVYDSMVTGKPQTICIELSLRYPLSNEPLIAPLKHFYTDFNDPLLKSHPIVAVSLNEIVSRKSYAAIKFLRNPVNRLRDYYDMWRLMKEGFDFYNKDFLMTFQKELYKDGYLGDWGEGFRRQDPNHPILDKPKEILSQFCRCDEVFDLAGAFEVFNAIFRDPRYRGGLFNQTRLGLRKLQSALADHLRI